MYASCFEFIAQYSIGHTQVPAGRCLTTLAVIQLLAHVPRSAEEGVLGVNTNSSPTS